MTSEQIWRKHKGYPAWDEGWEVDRDPQLGILWAWTGGIRIWRKDDGQSI